MKIYIIIKDIYIISRLKNIINNDNLFYFQNIDKAYNFIIEHGMPNILIYEYSKENEKIITLSQYLDTPLFYSIVLFNYFNETLIKNHLQNYYGDFFILSNNINELGLHILQIINNYYYKYTINKDITFSELNNTINDGLHTIKFTKLEYNLFRYLFLKTNQIVTRKEIQLSVWGFDEYDVFSRSIDTHIKLIRKKLNQYPLFKYKILTVRGKGYSLISNMLKHKQIE